MDILKSLWPLWLSVVEYFRRNHVEPMVSERDIETARSRTQSEGVTFLASYLPDLAADVYTSFKTGFIDVKSRFKLQRTRALPVFLQGYFNELYTREGYLRELTPARQRLFKELLQILGQFKKLGGPSSPELELEMADKFVALQQDAPRLANLVMLDGKYNMILSSAANLLEKVFRDFEWSGRYAHGNGAVAENFHNAVKISRPIMGGFETVLPDWSSDWVKTWTESAKSKFSETERICKVVFVDKSFKKKRMIFKLDSDSQSIQQGQMVDLMEYLERNQLTSGLVNFTDQSLNQIAAALGTTNGYGTIDMSDASDRVWWSLVAYLMPAKVLKGLEKSRVERCRLKTSKGLETIYLETFAPMGASNCFPILGVTLWSLAQACSNRLKGREVLTYGDDLCVPGEVIAMLLNLLEELGMKPNHSKSYWHGSFRESCGFDILAETEVTVARYREGPFTVQSKLERESSLPVKERKYTGSRRVSLENEAFLSEIGFINSVIRLFGEELGEVVARTVEETSKRGIIRTRKDYGIPTSVRLPDLSGTNRMRTTTHRRWNKNLHYFEVKVLTFEMSSTKGINEVSQCFEDSIDAPACQALAASMWEVGRYSYVYQGLKPGYPSNWVERIFGRSESKYKSYTFKTYEECFWVQDFLDKFLRKESSIIDDVPVFPIRGTLKSTWQWFPESYLVD